MANIQVGKNAAIDSVSTQQQPKKAADETQKHLKNVKDIGLGAATGAVIGGLLPGGVLLGASAGAAAVAVKKAAAAAGAQKSEIKADTVSHQSAQQTETQPAEGKGKQIAKSALGLGMGAALLGAPGAAMGLALSTPIVTEKAKEALNGLKDFINKHADKMQAAADQ